MTIASTAMTSRARGQSMPGISSLAQTPTLLPGGRLAELQSVIAALMLRSNGEHENKTLQMVIFRRVRSQRFVWKDVVERKVAPVLASISDDEFPHSLLNLVANEGIELKNAKSFENFGYPPFDICSVTDQMISDAVNVLIKVLCKLDPHVEVRRELRTAAKGFEAPSPRALARAYSSIRSKDTLLPVDRN